MLGRKSLLSLVVVSVVCATPGFAQAQTTLWNFLGIPQGIRKIQGATINRRGNFPGLEPKPPLKALADPANLESKNPAIKKAAEIKTEEDLAKQKIKALKYLATIGCGCYPGVKEALLAALDDCTEKVRYQAALAIGEAAENLCETCNRDCCCDEEMTKRLAEVAYERDEHGCWLEPSARVREAARQAMCACCRAHPDRGGYPIDVEFIDRGEVPDTTLPPETPSLELPGEVPGNDPPPPPPAPEARTPNPSPELIFSSADNSAPRGGSTRSSRTPPAAIPSARPLPQPAPAVAMAEKLQSFRQRQQRIPAASDAELHSTQSDVPQRIPPVESVRVENRPAQPLALADALAVLRQEGVATSVDDGLIDDEDFDLPEEPAEVQAVAVERPTPRFAMASAINEPVRSKLASRAEPVVRPISAASR